MFGGKTKYNPLNSPTQPVTATPTAHWATSVTQLQASVSADKEPQGGSALTVSRASGASPAAPPVSVTAMQTSAIPARENAEAAGTSQQDISVSGKENSVPHFSSFVRVIKLKANLLSHFVPVAWTRSLETQHLDQGSTAGPAPAQITPTPITSMRYLVRLTTPLIRSCVTANRATWVSAGSYWFIHPCLTDSTVLSSKWKRLVSLFQLFSRRSSVWPVCPWLLW